MNSQEKLNWIEERISEGFTVFVQSYTRVWEVTPKTAKRWANNGNQLFKANENGLFMARGKNWDCIDGCRISASKDE